MILLTHSSAGPRAGARRWIEIGGCKRPQILDGGLQPPVSIHLAAHGAVECG